MTTTENRQSSDITSVHVPDTDDPAITVEPYSETRISLVLYGGVSLAVYMTGACQELLAAVRATSGRIPDDQLTPTERVYRELAADAGPNGTPRRVVVDVMAGSSAGGLNAIFLAKTLAHGGDISGLRDVWHQEADLLRLLNSDEPLPDPIRPNAMLAPKSLLDGSKFHQLLLQELQRISDAEDAVGLVDQIECFVTATDLRGVAERVQLGGNGSNGPGMAVEELKRKAVFHFRHESLEQHDFHADNDRVLAFAGRATAAHPAAFHPAQWNEVEAHLGVEDNIDPALERFLAPNQDPDGRQLRLNERWYSDGGAMDNKPFKYALEPLERRRSQVPVDRKLLYIEPDPVTTHQDWHNTSEPSLWDYTAGTYSLARTENIRDDIESLARRNDAVARMSVAIDVLFERPLLQVEDEVAETGSVTPAYAHRAIGDGAAAKQVVGDVLEENYRRFSGDSNENLSGVVGSWISQRPDSVAETRGWGFISQEEYRWRSMVSDLVATVLATEHTEPDMSVVRSLSPVVESRIAEWLEAEYSKQIDAECKKGDELHRRQMVRRLGLVLLDVGFRLRRFTLIEHLLSHYQRSLLGPDQSQEDAEAFNECRRIRRDINYLYDELYRVVDERRRDQLPPDFHGSPVPLLKEFIATPAFDEVIERAITRLAGPLKLASDSGRDIIVGCQLDTEMKMRLTDAWINYGDYDQLIQPLQESAGTNMETIEAFRVSPTDATVLVDENRSEGRRRKLGGNALAHFGGFIDANWRLNDITWGRFDAAEVLVRRILAGSDSDDKAIRERVRKLHRAQFEELLQEEARVRQTVADSNGEHRDGHGPLGALLACNSNSESVLHLTAEDSLTRACAPDASTDDRDTAIDALFALLDQPDIDLTREHSADSDASTNGSMKASAGSPGITATTAGPVAADTSPWSVDLSATEGRTRTKSQVFNQGSGVMGKALALSGTKVKPYRVALGRMMKSSLTLTFPESPRQWLARVALPITWSAMVVTLAYWVLRFDRWGALALTIGALTAIALAAYCWGRAFGTLKRARPWKILSVITGLGGVALLAAGFALSPGGASATLLASSIFLVGSSAEFGLRSLKRILKAFGHP